VTKMSEDDDRSGNRREPLKSTLNYDAANIARKKRRHDSRKLRKEKFLSKKRKDEISDEDESIVSTTLKTIKQQPQFNAPILAEVTQLQILGKTPKLWKRAPPTKPPHAMEGHELMAFAVNSIMDMMPTFETSRSQIYTIVNSALSHPNVASIMQQDDWLIYGIREPPRECLNAMHHIIKASNYTDKNAWLFLAILMNGFRTTREWAHSIASPMQNQITYNDSFRERLCNYVNTFLIPEIATTLEAPANHTTAHICSACKVLECLFDDYEDNEMLVWVCSESDALPKLLRLLCAFATAGIANQSTGLFESPAWFGVMTHIKKMAIWFSAFVRRCTRELPTKLSVESSDHVSPEMRALCLYRESGTPAMVCALAQMLSSRVYPKKNLETFRFAITLISSVIPYCANCYEDCSPNDLYHAAIELCQTTPYHSDEAMKTSLTKDFFDFVIITTGERFTSVNGDHPRIYSEMYKNFAHVIETTAAAMAKNQAIANEFEGQFETIRGNIAEDSAGREVLSDFAAYPNLYRLTIMQFRYEVENKGNILFKGQTIEMDVFLDSLTKICKSAAVIISPLRHRLAAMPSKQELTFRVLADSVLLGSATFWGMTTHPSVDPAFLQSIQPHDTDALLSSLPSSLDPNTTYIHEKRMWECSRNLITVRYILELYNSLLKNTSVAIAKMCLDINPKNSCSKLNHAISSVLAKTGRPTFNQGVAHELMVCQRLVEQIRVSYDPAETAVGRYFAQSTMY